MTDEAKPPKKKPAARPKRPRKQPGEGAARARKPAAPKNAAEGAASAHAGADAAAGGDPFETPEIAADAAAESATETAAQRRPLTQAPDPALNEALRGSAADTAPTRIVGGPAPDAAPTEVIGGTAPDAAQTQVLGATGPPPPPPAFTPLPKVATPSGGGDRRTTLWIVLAVAAIAVAAVILVWAFAVRDTGDQFVGIWAPVSGEGGGLEVGKDDGNFFVAMYAADLSFIGRYPAVRDGDTLTFRLSGEEGGQGLTDARLTYVEDRDALLLEVAGGGTATEYVRVDALEAAPTPTPVPVPTPTASLTGSPTGSPSPTPSPTGTDTTEKDRDVVDGIVAIQVGLLNWRTANGNVFPPASEVSQSGGVGEYVSPWPTNPYTGQPMAPGDQPGDFTYEQLNGGEGYRLVGHLANGFTFTVP